MSLRKNRIGSRSRSVPDHQDGNLFPGEPPFCGPPTHFSGPSCESASLPLVGSQEQCLIGFDNLAFLPGFQTGKAKNRCLHNKRAFVLIPHRQAAFRTDSSSLNFSRKYIQRSLW